LKHEEEEGERKGSMTLMKGIEGGGGTGGKIGGGGNE